MFFVLHFIINLGLDSVILLQLAFLGESHTVYYGENSHWDNKVYKMQKQRYVWICIRRSNLTLELKPECVI